MTGHRETIMAHNAAADARQAASIITAIEQTITLIDRGSVNAKLISALLAECKGTIAAVVPVAVPEGWQLVPKEPTREMVEASISERAKNPTNVNGAFIYRAMLAAAPALTPAEKAGVGDGQRLYDDAEMMADGGDIRMTAAEEVLAWLLIEKIGVPDDVGYSPKQAQEIIERRLDQVRELEQIDDMLDEGQGDDDGSPIMPEFAKGISTYAKVEACLHLLERRRDAIDGFVAKEKAASQGEVEAAISLGAAVLTRIEDPAAREIAIRNALKAAAAASETYPSSRALSTTKPAQGDGE